MLLRRAPRRGHRTGSAACCAFAEQFYAALLRGLAVRRAFEIAQSAGSGEYLLLPEQGDHDVPLVSADDGILATADVSAAAEITFLDAR